MKHIKKFSEINEIFGWGKNKKEEIRSEGTPDTNKSEKLKVGDYLECINNYKWLITLFDVKFASDSGNYDSFLDKARDKNRYLFTKGEKYKIVEVLGSGSVTLESNAEKRVNGEPQQQIFTVSNKSRKVGYITIPADNYFPELEKYFKF